VGKKKKKQEAQGRKNWFLVIGALVSAVAALVFAFLAGRDFDFGSLLSQDPDQDPEDQEQVKTDNEQTG